jgi:trehalose 6-phosphate synthase
MNQRVLVASNRGPVSYQFGADGSLTTSRGGGGMIAGVTDGLAALGPEASATWICAALSDADRAVARARDADRRDEEPIAVRMLDIAPDVFDRAYNRVANSTLWFLLHQLFDTPSQPRFGHGFRRDWAAYLAYNEAFAEALVQEAATGAGDLRVLIQDYHLCLVPRMFRDRLRGQPGGHAGGHPAARIGHFCHTPWASPDYYRMLPDEVGRALLDGILGADRAGFHAERWASAFMDCCAAVLGADVTRTGLAGPGPGPVGRVTYRGHVTEVAVHPLGVDAPALRESARAADVRTHADTLRQAAGDRKLIVRVDRTELSKNIVRGLEAYRELLTTRPQWRGQVVHLVFAYPSRSAVPEYRAYTDRVRQLALEITEEFGTADWDPLILEVKDDYPRSLAAYALADVLLVNPIRDGMNLVAQEGVVLSERGCALVLSREAGAAATLAADALLVNPFDVTETAEALHRALAMSDAERQRRGAALAATAAADPPARWLGGQLASLGPGS